MSASSNAPSAISPARSHSRSLRALTEKVSISAEEIKGYLGPPRVYPEEARKELPAGVATGMAWTEMGGEVLFIEATLLPGGSGLTLTGQLGDVMTESAQAARSYLWSHAAEFGIDPRS